MKIIDISPGTPGNPFLGCTSLTGINVGEKNENYSSIDGVLYNKEKYIGKFVHLNYGERAGVQKVPFHVKDCIIK